MLSKREALGVKPGKRAGVGTGNDSRSRLRLIPLTPDYHLVNMAEFEPLTTNAHDLQRMLQSGTVTSVQIVERYLEQIHRYNPKLKALVSIAPADDLYRIAKRLDDERREGLLRSPLHGVPIVLKDCFITSSDLGMTTCAGATVFASAKASENAAIVEMLVRSGLIIIAKSNMTEFAGMKTIKMMPGWSPQGGQTISPYTGPILENERLLGHSAPGGSSTGSAVAVAAGFSPLSLGAETIGSIVTPTVRAGLYALKPTVGVQNTTGMYRMTEFYDSPGPMGKCAADILALSELLLGRPLQSSGMGTWDGLRVAFLDPSDWKMDVSMCEQFPGTEEQMREEYAAAIMRMEERGCYVKYPAAIADVSELDIGGKSTGIHISFWDFKHIGLPEFIDAFNECPVTQLEDIVNFNDANRATAMPEPYTEQDLLLRAQGFADSPEEINVMKEELRAKGRSILDEVFERDNVDLIGAPGDSPLCVHAAAAGYPHATVPLGQLRHNGRPFGLNVVARQNNEDILMRFMTAYERQAYPRPLPSL
ncbi:hypothetical protein PG987_008031 [Apiospora arundinis]